MTDQVTKLAPNETPSMQQMQAMIIPLPLFSQMLELIRGNCIHRDADPIMQQCIQLKPQTVSYKGQEQ